MTTRRERPSPDQWARLDAALQELRDRPPTHVSPSLGREIEKRADMIRTLLQSGWRIRDLAVFFRETAGIAVSATTIQTGLRQAMDGKSPVAGKSRAKRPRRRSRPETESRSAPEPFAPPSVQQAGATKTALPKHGAEESTGLGSLLTQGARKRGER